MRHNLCFLVTLILVFGYSFGQELPPVACPDNFAYLKLGDRYVGQVSVVLNGSYTENNVKVELTVRGVSALKNVGEIQVSDSGVTVRDKLIKNEKINFQMDMSSKDVLPKVQRIIVNGETICQDVSYEPPFTLFTKTMNFYTKSPILAKDKGEDILGTN
ncbi:hypothetical protein KR200_006395 [Drosophila serrata]|nr:hypothetical protein KR200_006395 [Drosophila serrata]